MGEFDQHPPGLRERAVVGGPRVRLELGIVCRRDLKDDKRAAAAFHEYVKRGGSDERVPKWLTQIEK
jgi:hypothetical protein